MPLWAVEAQTVDLEGKKNPDFPKIKHAYTK